MGDKKNDVLQGTLVLPVLRTLASNKRMPGYAREARFYSLTAIGRKQLQREEEGWRRLTEGVARLIRLA
jgi:DNA-binding PadR family transcriptional regulator